MDLVERFNAYAAAFEEAFASDDWSKVAPFFTDDAVYDSFGERHEGRSAILAHFKKSVNEFDRRFDTRQVELVEGPVEKDGGVWMRWAATYQRTGAPDLHIEGEERAFFVGDRMRHLEDRITEEEGKRMRSYFAEHDAKLKPAR